MIFTLSFLGQGHEYSVKVMIATFISISNLEKLVKFVHELIIVVISHKAYSGILQVFLLALLDDLFIVTNDSTKTSFKLVYGLYDTDNIKFSVDSLVTSLVNFFLIICKGRVLVLTLTT